MPITKAAMQMMVYKISKGMINLNHVLKLMLTIASDGNTRPVGARKDIRHIPYI